jgi:predicted nuclease with RNAse H fold
MVTNTRINREVPQIRLSVPGKSSSGPGVPYVAGVDLAGSPGRNTGICLLRGLTITSFATVYSDEEILAFIERAYPVLVAIDAPLSLPPGRTSLEERNGEHFRTCDRELLKRGIRFFPITLGPMRTLTMRGIRLKEMLIRRGYEVIEIYPGAAQDIWGIPRKQGGLAKLRRGLEQLGLKGLAKNMNGDELDAVTGALVGRMYLKGQAEVLGNFTNGAMVIPKPARRKR